MFLGELAALATSVCWSFTSTFFTLAGRMVGPVVVNRVRLLLALLFLTLSHWLFGIPLPFGVEAWRWGWLALSGILGLVLGDAFLFQAFVWIGPRLSMLLMSLAPVIATVLAWIFLDEKLSALQLAGIVLTVAGIAWVVARQPGDAATRPHGRTYKLGILCGLGAATGQALGLITAKIGLAGDFPALSGTLMRMLAATAVLWGVTLLLGQARITVQRLRQQPGALRFLLAGAFFGPFIGVTLSLFAVQQTEVGIASTLMALPPIFLIPISRLVFHEQVGRRAVMGTVAAVAGVAMLALGG